MPSRVDILHFLGTVLVLIYVGIVIYRLSNAIDFPVEPFFNLLVRVDVPQFLEFVSELEEYAGCNIGVTSGLMHGSNPIHVQFLGHLA